MFPLSCSFSYALSYGIRSEYCPAIFFYACSDAANGGASNAFHGNNVERSGIDKDRNADATADGQPSADLTPRLNACEIEGELAKALIAVLDHTLLEDDVSVKSPLTSHQKCIRALGSRVKVKSFQSHGRSDLWIGAPDHFHELGFD